MKKFITFVFLLLQLGIQAQTADNPILIETSVQKISDTEYDIIFDAKLFEGWYLYSQYNPEDASLPLEITLQEGEIGYELVGKAIEKEPFKKYSDVWEKEEVVFKDKAQLIQRIKLTNKDISQIKLNFFGQVCEVACINVDENFTISLTGATITEVSTIDERSAELTNKLKLDLKNKALLKKGSTNNSEDSSSLFNIHR